jgi:hypothetical protein
MKKIFEKFRSLNEAEKAQVNEEFKKEFEDFQAKSKKFIENLPEKRIVDLNYYRTKILKKEPIKVAKPSLIVANNVEELLFDHDDDVKEITEDDNVEEKDEEEEEDEKESSVVDEEEECSVVSQSSNSSLVLKNQTLDIFINKSAKRPEK